MHSSIAPSKHQIQPEKKEWAGSSAGRHTVETASSSISNPHARTGTGSGVIRVIGSADHEQDS